MPKTKPKSNTLKKGLSKKKGFRLRWWMGLILVVVVAGIGLIILRFSQASGGTGVLYPNMPNAQICPPSFGVVKSAYMCRGELVDTADGSAWRTSVNLVPPPDQPPSWQWYGPYETLITGSGDTNIRACVTFRDNSKVLGVPAQFVLDITADNGTTILGTRTVNSQEGALQTTNNSITLQCVSSNFKQTLELGKNRSYNNVEYRVRMLRGSIDIFQVSRSIGSSITSSVGLPGVKPPSKLIWPVAAEQFPLTRCWREKVPGVSNTNHAGIDIGGNGIAGQPIIAGAAGTVTYSGYANNGFGNTVVIKHKDDLYTLYAHTQRNLVQTGQQVAQGQQIAIVGSSGGEYGAHLHFNVQKSGALITDANNETYNPLDHLEQTGRRSFRAISGKDCIPGPTGYVR